MFPLPYFRKKLEKLLPVLSESDDQPKEEQEAADEEY